MQYGISAWYSCLFVHLKATLNRLLCICSKIVGVESSFQTAYILKECCLWLVVLHQTPLIFYLKNIKQKIQSPTGLTEQSLLFLSLCYYLCRLSTESDSIDSTAATYLYCLMLNMIVVFVFD